MAQLTHAQYDALERAVIRGNRIAVLRRGRPESVIVPLSKQKHDGREATDARHPTTGDSMGVYLDEIDGFEVVW